MNGWISLYRSIQNHWLFEENRKFSKFEAWIDILLIVNYKDKKIMINNELINVKRGQKVTSLRKLAERWNWSITKVDHFLKVLEEECMIEVKKDTKKTVISVVNYNIYQSNGFEKINENDNDKTEKRIQNISKVKQKETNNNINKIYKENKVNKENNTIAARDSERKILNMYKENIEKHPNPITLKTLVKHCKKYNSEIMIYAIEKAALSGARNYKLIYYLLNLWEKNNLKIIDDIKTFENSELKNKSNNIIKFNNSKEMTPKWLFNKDSHNYRVTIDEDLEKDRKAFSELLEKEWGD